MNKTLMLSTLGLFSVLGMLALAACGPEQPAAAPTNAAPAATAPTDGALVAIKIEAFGPKSTKAGVAFNEQPDGSSAIWARTNQNLEGRDAALWFNGQRLGGRGIKASTVSGTIPASALATPGTYSLEIRIGADGSELASDKVDFVIE
ncbi:MAG: hypothetical protein QM761_00425 [Pseudoxanthomonas sp.]